MKLNMATQIRINTNTKTQKIIGHAIETLQTVIEHSIATLKKSMCNAIEIEQKPYALPLPIDNQGT